MDKRPGQAVTADNKQSETAKAAAAAPPQRAGSAAVELRDRGPDQL